MDQCHVGQTQAEALSTSEGEKLSERDQLFRNMAKLFSYVAETCDDKQLAQYDEALCLLAEVVEREARAHVAQILAPLSRAPGTALVKLANDDIEVARPLLEFSTVLSDDDLIEIVTRQSEHHREAIAGRKHVTERVGEAIVRHGETASLVRLVRNAGAALGPATLTTLVERARENSEIAADLRNRSEIDWQSVRGQIHSAADKVMASMSEGEDRIDPETAGRINAVVFNRIRNKAGFNGQEWKLAYNQVKALADRRQLDEQAITRFVRFGYGHQVAASVTVMLRIPPEIMVKWLASQDYAAVTVAMRALKMEAEQFGAIIGMLPWRDLPTDADRAMVASRFLALRENEAARIFEIWRAYSFRRRPEPPRPSFAMPA